MKILSEEDEVLFSLVMDKNDDFSNNVMCTNGLFGLLTYEQLEKISKKLIEQIIVI